MYYYELMHAYQMDQIIWMFIWLITVVNVIFKLCKRGIFRAHFICLHIINIKHESNRFSCLIWNRHYFGIEPSIDEKQLKCIASSLLKSNMIVVPANGWDSFNATDGRDGWITSVIVFASKTFSGRIFVLVFFFSRIEIHTFSWVVHNAAREFSIKHFISKLVQKERKKEKKNTKQNRRKINTQRERK